MSKSANPGELRTAITIKKYSETTGPNGYPIQTWANVFGEGKTALCKWVNAHGTEAIEAQRLDLKEPATLTMRYSPLITATCEIYRGSETKPFEIISLDNVEQRNQWLEIKVKRRVQAR